MHLSIHEQTNKLIKIMRPWTLSGMRLCQREKLNIWNCYFGSKIIYVALPYVTAPKTKKTSYQRKMDSMLKKFLGIPRWADPQLLRRITGIPSLEEMSIRARRRI